MQVGPLTSPGVCNRKLKISRINVNSRKQALKLVSQIPSQGSTIVVSRVLMYAYLSWRTPDFGHAYVDIYAHFSPYDFFMIFILFKNLSL